MDLCPCTAQQAACAPMEGDTLLLLWPHPCLWQPDHSCCWLLRLSCQKELHTTTAGFLSSNSTTSLSNIWQQQHVRRANERVNNYSPKKIHWCLVPTISLEAPRSSPSTLSQQAGSLCPSSISHHGPLYAPPEMLLWAFKHWAQPHKPHFRDKIVQLHIHGGKDPSTISK